LSRGLAGAATALLHHATSPEQQHAPHSPTTTAPADPERPAVGASTATSAPAGALDSLAQQQQHKDQGLVGRSKSDPTGTGHPSQRPQKDTLTAEQERTLQHIRVGSERGRGQAAAVGWWLGCAHTQPARGQPVPP
jgi:hypothetical protein